MINFNRVGSTRKVIFPILYSYILVSFITMETYIKWVTTSAIEQANGHGENKSKFVSGVIFSGFALQFIIDKVIPESMKGVQFYIFKIFFNNLLFFILTPIAVILFLETVRNYAKQFFSSIFSYIKEIKMVPVNIPRIHGGKVNPNTPPMDLQMHI